MHTKLTESCLYLGSVIRSRSIASLRVQLPAQSFSPNNPDSVSGDTSVNITTVQVEERVVEDANRADVQHLERLSRYMVHLETGA